MRTPLFILVTGLTLTVLIFVSCQSQVSSELTSEEKQMISKEIETRVRNFMNASTLTYQTYMELRANVEGYVLGGDGKIKFASFDALDQHMKVSFTGNAKFTELKIVALYPYVLSKDAATCTTLFKGKWMNASGDTVVNNGCWTFVFKKFENVWKVVQENGTHTKD